MDAAKDFFRYQSTDRMPKKTSAKKERVPQSIIDSLLEKVSLLDLIKESTHVKAVGGNHVAHCPFHARGKNDYTLSIDSENNLFSCGDCAFKGSAIGWLMYHDGLSFQDSVYMLAEASGVDVSQWISSDDIERSRLKKVSLLDEVAHYFSSELSASDSALNYLRSRGISDETIDKFGIGYASNDKTSLESAFPRRNRDLWNQGVLVRLSDGLFARRFRDRVIFPIKDQAGYVVGFGGRALDDGNPKYLNSPTSPLFSKSELLYGLSESIDSGDNDAPFVLVEGYVDVLSLHQSGLTSAIATLGTSPSGSHLETIFSQRDSLIACFDGDSAGVKAAERLLIAALPVLKEAQSLSFALLPSGHDPDSMIREAGIDGFERCLSTAFSIESFFINTLSHSLDLNSIGGKSRLAMLARPLVESVVCERLRESLICVVEDAIEVEWFDL